MRERYEGYIVGYESCLSSFRRFAGRVSLVLGIKAFKGCKNKTWDGFCNGNGTDIGNDIKSIVRTAQKLSK